jgi:DNA-binding MarR family transcriptional regulator
VPSQRKNLRKGIGSVCDYLCKPIKDNKLDEFIVLNQFIDVQISTANQLKNYLEMLSGTSPHLEPLQVAHLPLFLRNRFSFFSSELFGRPWCLALEDESWDSGSAGEYEKQAQTLRPLLKASVVFVLSALPSNARNRMVQKGIPFIVPGTQAFLPGALVDLRERFPKPSEKGRTSLSPTAQLSLLYHLEREPLSGMPLRNIAEKLHCSAMMLSKVKDELEEAGICEVERVGRSMALKFSAANRDLWNLAQNRLTSPVKKVRWVQWKTPGYPALLAGDSAMLSGISALSRRTMLAADRLPTYALGPKMLESWLEQGTMIGCPDAEQANAKIEVWAYEPKLLGDNEAVDPLSLYLSLRYNADERVHQQLEKLIEEIKW